MKRLSNRSFVACIAIFGGSLATVKVEAASDGVYVASPVLQSEADEYTRYELLAPESGSFRITYEVTATTPSARYFYNPIRKGSAASDERVRDAATGAALHFDIVSGREARKDPLMADAEPDARYIRVALARAVPANGQARIVIEKTYKDPKSYHRNGGSIVFERSLSIRRNKVVLPQGYEVSDLNVPSQILVEADGRIAVSFLNAGTAESLFVVRAIKDAQAGPQALPKPLGQKRSWESPFEGETEQDRLSERAHQDREIVYFLQQPETHSFRLYHDYTERRSGVSAYVNVVREGSIATDPEAVLLDTGQVLKVQEMSGRDVTTAGLDGGESLPPNARAIVIAFDPVKPGQSVRLRITETYTAPASYRLEGDELVFDRSLGRPRNAVVLPTGWYVTHSATPTTVTALPDGRQRLDYWDDRPEPVDVLVKAQRRVTQQ